MEMIEFILSLKVEVPIMVGVGGHNLSDTTDWLNFLETLSIDA